jgi:hypothetical protein
MATASPPVLAQRRRSWIAEAWNEYLEDTREAGRSGCYDVVEPWAWRRLEARLADIRRRFPA